MQWVLVGPTPIEGVERTNIVIVCLTQQTGFALHNLYIMDIDRERNCYSCRGFGHLIWNCKR